MLALQHKWTGLDCIAHWSKRVGLWLLACTTHPPSKLPTCSGPPWAISASAWLCQRRETNRFALQPHRWAGPLGASSRTFDQRRLCSGSHSRHLTKSKHTTCPAITWAIQQHTDCTGGKKLLSISSEANMMEADVIFMTQSSATWRRAFQACFQQEVMVMMPSRASSLLATPSVHIRTVLSLRSRWLCFSPS